MLITKHVFLGNSKDLLSKLKIMLKIKHQLLKKRIYGYIELLHVRIILILLRSSTKLAFMTFINNNQF